MNICMQCHAKCGCQVPFDIHMTSNTPCEKCRRSSGLSGYCLYASFDFPKPQEKTQLPLPTLSDAVVLLKVFLLPLPDQGDIVRRTKEFLARVENPNVDLTA